MTCKCGHHEAVHQRMCNAPEGCSCNMFVEAKPVPASPTRYAEMTGDELARASWSGELGAAGSLAALRDAILAERDAENKVVLAYWKERVERLELERDAQTLVLECVKADLSRSRDAHNAAIRERDALKVRAERALEERDAAMRGAAGLANQLCTAESALGEAKREGAREFARKVLEAHFDA